jgi:hypothetical protein
MVHMANHEARSPETSPSASRSAALLNKSSIAFVRCGDSGDKATRYQCVGEKCFIFEAEVVV